MSKGIDIGDAAMHRLAHDTIRQYGANGPNIQTAIGHLDGLTGTKPELIEAIAYLALQVAAYRKIANEDAALAIHNIDSIVKAYKERSA